MNNSKQSNELEALLLFLYFLSELVVAWLHHRLNLGGTFTSQGSV